MSDAALAVPAVTHAHLRRDAVAALTAYRPSDGSQQRLRDDYLAHLTIHPDGVARQGHRSTSRHRAWWSSSQHDTCC